jgi:hypothetical protein
MGMTHAYGAGYEESGLQTIYRALELPESGIAGTRYSASDMELLSH